MGKTKVFLDSDVIISSLLSKKGASFSIVENENLEKIISDVIKTEVVEVSKRLNSPLGKSNLFKSIKIISLQINKGRLVDEYARYVADIEDSHVVFGAKMAKVKFLLTHNTKHYHVEKIKRDLGVLVMRPGIFLQYLRSS